MARIKRDPKDVEIANQIIKAYQPKTAADVENAIKSAFAPIFEAILKGEMDAHLGYESNDKGPKNTDNRRNGYDSKDIRTSYGELSINVPRDRDGSFEPISVPKGSKDVTAIEDKVLSLYAKGMSQRDIADTIEDIYNYKLSPEKISKITDCVLDEMHKWRTRLLKKVYPFVFVDCLYVDIRRDGIVKNEAVYVVLGYDLQGYKDILGIWISESESKHFWMGIFDEIKSRGVEDIFIVSMDGVSGLEAGLKSIYPKTVTQRCIIHLTRNSIKYVPTKDYKEFTRDLKNVYGAVNVETAKENFDKFCDKWNKYPSAVKVWKNHFDQVEQLFDFPSDIRRVMYTTNAIESINSSLRKVIKKGAFTSDDSVYKALYLRTKELHKKWTRPIRNWALILNQFDLDSRFHDRIEKYMY